MYWNNKPTTPYFNYKLNGSLVFNEMILQYLIYAVFSEYWLTLIYRLSILLSILKNASKKWTQFSQNLLI